MGITPLQWDLPKLSAADVARSAVVLQLFPGAELRQQVQVAVQQALREQFGAQASCSFEALSTQRYGELCESLGAASVMTQLELAPAGAPCYLQLDHDCVGQCVDRLLGGDGGRHVDPTALTETELGVLQYCVMHALSAVHHATGAEAAYHVRFHSFVQDAAACRELLPPSAELVVVTWKLVLGEVAHFVRLLLPQAFLDAVQSDRSRVQTAPSVTRAQVFGGEFVEAWFDAGQCEVSAGDLGSLEIGDVVLLDKSAVQYRSDELGGHTVLRLGEGQHGGIRCRIADQQCVIEGME